MENVPDPADARHAQILTTLVHGDEGARWDASLSPSIAQGVNWSLDSAEAFSAVATEPQHPFFYNRHGNANHNQVATMIAQLEGAEDALMTASGMSALLTAVLTVVRSGDHVVGQRSMYGGTTKLMSSLLPRLGVECTQVDQGDTEAFAAAMRPNTSLVLLETPSNPRLEVTDLAAVAEIARRHGAVTLADNTFATPLNQRPLEHGIDLVWHSATKYLGGHGDLMAGVIAGSRDRVVAMWETAQVTGAVLAPFNAWLLLRGLRTLSLRMAQHNANGMALATALDGHPAVSRVHYPGLAEHRGHEVAARQMEGFGGVLGIELAGGFDAADAFIGHLRLAKRASSLGDVRSLVVHPASLFAKVMSPDDLVAAGIAPGLVRFAAGIEGTDDLLEDVAGALDRVSQAVA
jgi:methionine-gamma-lyase